MNTDLILRHSGSRGLFILKSLWGRAAGTLFAVLEARNARCQLLSMDDHMLRDIGIRRDQIHCISKRIPW